MTGHDSDATRTPEHIPAAALARADQLQARATSEGPALHALLTAAEADAAEQAAAGEQPMGLDDLAAMLRAELELDDVVGPGDIRG